MSTILLTRGNNIVDLPTWLLFTKLLTDKCYGTEPRKTKIISAKPKYFFQKVNQSVTRCVCVPFVFLNTSSRQLYLEAYQNINIDLHVFRKAPPALSAEGSELFPNTLAQIKYGKRKTTCRFLLCTGQKIKTWI